MDIMELISTLPFPQDYMEVNRIDNDFTVYRFTASPLSVKFGKPEFEGKIRTPKEAFKISPTCSLSDPTCQNIKQIVFVVVLAAFKSIL